MIHDMETIQSIHCIIFIWEDGYWMQVCDLIHLISVSAIHTLGKR